MTDADRPVLSALVNGCCALFGAEPTDAALAAWWAALEDLPLAAVRAAFTEALRTCQHMPRPVEIRRLAGEPGPSDIEAEALRSWRFVMDCAAGREDPGELVDLPITAEAVRLIGGLRRLGDLSEDVAEAHERRRYVECYAAARRSAARPALPAATQLGLPEPGGWR